MCDSAVDIVTGMQAGQRSNGGSIPDRAREFSLLRSVQTGSGITRCPLLFSAGGGEVKRGGCRGLSLPASSGTYELLPAVKKLYQLRPKVAASCVSVASRVVSPKVKEVYQLRP